jgi:hypothetical protein
LNGHKAEHEQQLTNENITPITQTSKLGVFDKLAKKIEYYHIFILTWWPSRVFALLFAVTMWVLAGICISRLPVSSYFLSTSN